MRRAAFLVFGWCILATSIPGSARAASEPEAPQSLTPIFSDSVDVNVVNVDVLVTDRNGKPVPGLRKGDFKLFEDGRAVDISNFEEIGRASSLPAPTPGSAGAQGRTEGAPAAASTPLRLVIYFDHRNIRLASRTRAVGQIRDFVRDQLAPGDEVMVATHDLRLHVPQPFTADRDVIEEALRRLETAPTYGDASDRDRGAALSAILTLQSLAKVKVNKQVGEMELEPSCSLAIAQPAESYAEATRAEVERTARAVTVLVDSLAGIPGRKALLYVSDGVPLTPGEELFQVLYELCGGDPSSGLGLAIDVAALEAADTYNGQRALLDAQRYHTADLWNKVTTHANSNRVAFYTLQARNPIDAVSGAIAGEKGEQLLRLPRISSALSANFQNTLSLMASETGGRTIFNATDLASDLGRMRGDFDHFYSLGYTPSSKAGRSTHRLEVRVKGPGLRVAHQRGVSTRSPIEKAADRTLSALFWEREENPLAAGIEVGEQILGEDGAYSVPLRLRIPLFKLAVLNQGEQFSADLRLLVASRDAAGAVDPLRQVMVPIRIPNREVLKALGQYFVYNLTLRFPPGERRFAVTIRDEVASTTSYLTRTIQVGAASASAAR
jgi:VWFA-related protein